MKRYLLLIPFLLIPYEGISQVATDSLTCFTPTQLRLIAQDIERGKQCQEIVNLKEDMIVNLEVQINVRDSIISYERGIKSLTQDVHQEQMKKRTLVSLLSGLGSGIVSVLLLL